jgi:DinB family protein
MAASASIPTWRRRARKELLTSRAATMRFVKTLPRADVLRARTQDAWSVKDVLVHLLSCDEETLRRFRLIAQGRADRIVWFDMAHANRFNARSVARGRRLGLPIVLRRLARVRAEMVRLFDRLPNASLRDPAHDYTLMSWLPAPGWSHERDHIGEVQRWWRAERAAGAPSRPHRRPRPRRR